MLKTRSFGRKRSQKQRKISNIKKPISFLNQNSEFKDGLDFSDFKNFSIKNNRDIKCLFGPKWDGPHELRKKRGFYPKKGHLGLVGKYLLQGFSIDKVQKLVGCSKDTVSRFRRYLVHLYGEIYCKCGRVSTHKGWCREKLINMDEGKIGKWKAIK